MGVTARRAAGISTNARFDRVGGIVAFRAGSTRRRHYRSPQVKRFYWIIGGVIIAVVLTVLFVPGVAEYIERRVILLLITLGT